VGSFLQFLVAPCLCYLSVWYVLVCCVMNIHTGVVKSSYIKFRRHIFMSYVCVYDFLSFMYIYGYFCDGTLFWKSFLRRTHAGTAFWNLFFLILVQRNTTPLQQNCGSLCTLETFFKEYVCVCVCVYIYIYICMFGCMKLSNLTFDFNYKSVCIHAASAWILWLSQKDLTIVHLVGGL
jgi:hypothetical protein